MDPSDFLDVSGGDVFGGLTPSKPLQPQMPQPRLAIQPAPVATRSFTDSPTLREAIYTRAVEAARKLPVVQNNRFSLAIENADYADPGTFSLAEQKRALLESRTLGRRLRGDWVLRTADGQEVERKRTTLATIPFLTDRGTFINNGTEYAMCLHGTSMIWTEHGLLPIRKIVQEKLAVRVYSWDAETQSFVLKPVVNWYRNKLTTKLGVASFTRRALQPSLQKGAAFGTLWATPTHDLVFADGTKQPIGAAAELLRVEERLTPSQLQLLYGTYLGDAHLREDGIYACVHGEAQREYAELKHAILGSVVRMPVQDFRQKSRKSGLKEHKGCRFHTASHPAFFALWEEGYVNGVCTATESVIANLTAEGLAYWYGDDGSIEIIRKTNCQMVTLHTNHFALPCVQKLQLMLKTRFGLDANIAKVQNTVTNPNGGFVLQLIGEDARKLLDMVAPYLPTCLHYKLGNRPNTNRCDCGKEIAKTTTYCHNCLVEKQRYLRAIDKTARYKFGNSAIVRDMLAGAIPIPPDITGVERWEARMAAAGSQIPRILQDTSPTYGLVAYPFDYDPSPAKEYAKVNYAYDIEVADTHNYVANGVLVSNCHQFRLRPGIYSRIKKNGLIEAHMNVLRGPSHKLELEPETGVFHFAISQAKIPAVNVLRAMGVTPQQMEEAWGPETARANLAKLDPTFNRRLIEKLKIKKGEDESEADAITRTYLNMGIDPEVTQRTLGVDRDHIDADVLMRTTSKLMRVARQEEDPDERDAIPFQTVHGPEDIIAERLAKSRGTLQKALWKMSREGKLGSYASNALNDDVRSALLSSRLGMALEEVNPAEIMDQQQRVSRMGVGGIENAEAVPVESRAVHPTQVGFVDFLRTAESGQVGVDLRFAAAARKGADNKLYTSVKAPDGSIVEKNAGDLFDEFVAFPGELDSGKQAIPVIHKGRVISVPKDRVTYEFPPSEQLFSAMANLDAGKAGVKGQRMVMASRMLQQALSLKEGEAPFVRGATAEDPEKSYEELYSDKMGAVRSQQSGRIVSVSPDEIVMKQEDGTEKRIELYKDFPFNRKSSITQTPMVKPGDLVQANQLLAKSNYTDDKGVMAVGRNLRIAYVPYKGKNWEDAVVMSESAAKKFTSEHMYMHDHEINKRDRLGKKSFVSIFPTKFDKATLDKFDDDGTIKPGTVVQPGDPLFLLVQERERDRKSLLRTSKTPFQDKTLLWDQDYEGVVTDVVNNGKNVSVVVKTYKPSQIGDKFCYSEDTSILTATGWKPVSQITLQDKIASLTPDGFVEYLNPVATHAYRHTGRMYEIDTTQVSHCVTDNHMLYAKRRGRDTYALHTAESLYKKRYRLKMDADWVGQSPEYVTIPGFTVPCGQGGAGRRRLPDLQIPTHAFMGLLGIYLSEGSVVNKKRKDKHTSYNRRVSIAQKKQHGLDRFWQELAPVLEAAGLKPKPAKGYGIIFHDARLSAYFAQFGHCTDKFIPDWVFECNKADLEMLYRWLMWGDGCEGGTGHCYTSTSLRLCQDVQRLCLHTGRAAKVELSREEGIQLIKGKKGWCNAAYKAHIYREKLCPEINHSHVAKQTRGEADRWIAYDGMVYCVTLPRNHVLYTSRDGKPVWSGNSGRYGDKGLVADILRDDEMPQDESGKPFDILVSPLGLTSRINPTQLVEAALGKIAEKTGKPFNLKDFDSKTDYAEFAVKELEKHGLKDYETIIDPKTGRRIPNIATGNRWFMKLHHMAADKLQGRGLGGYSSDDSPAGKTDTSDASKRIGMLEVSSLLSSGATEVLREASLIRGQANPDYWSKFMSGYDPVTPEVPFVYEKFVNMLRAAGVNPVRNGPKVQLMALTDKAIDELTGDREITNSETVNWKNMEPVKGGLFDAAATGGHATTGRGANLWSHVKLHTPLPNPVMEEPIRRILGLTKPKFEQIMTRKEQLAGSTGPEAIAKALENIDLPKLLAETKQAVKSSSKTKRDEAIRKLAILHGADKTGIHPKEWVVSKVPVLPPAFRPVSVMGDKKLPLVDDANYLYKELIDTNNSVKKLSEQLDPDDYADELYGVYKSFKAVTGLGEPQHPKNVERKVRGVIKNIIGPGGPKTGYMQRKMLGSTVDFVSRGAIIPNPDLSMDQVGVPESKAWDMYSPMVVRRLVRAGLPRLKAMEMVEKQDPRARRELLAEMDDAVVVWNRAPTLHRYGIMAAKPVLTSNKVIELPPFVFKGAGADVDGDAQIGTVAWRNKFGNIPRSVSTHFPAIFTEEGQNVFRNLSVPSLQNCQCFISDLADFPRAELQRISMVGDLKTEWYGVPEGTQVLGMSPTGECGWFDVQNYSVHPDRELEIVTLQSGRQIYTDNDPRAVFGVGYGDPTLRRFTPTDALASKVLVPRVIGNAAPAGPVLQELDLRPFARSSAKAHKLADSILLDAQTGWFFGAAVGDGWASIVEKSRPVTVNFAKLRDSTREAFDTSLQRFFVAKIATDTRESVGEYGDRKKYVLASSAAANMLVSFIGHGALNKHLPHWFLNTSRDFRNGLLSGLMDTDGCIAVSTVKPEYGKKEQMAPTYSTSSFRLAREVVLLCQSLGIPATVGSFDREGKNTAYTVYISSYAFGEWAVREHKMIDTDKLAALEYRPLEVSPALARHDRVPITPALFNALYAFVRKPKDKKSAPPLERSFINARAGILKNGYCTRDFAKRFLTFAELKAFDHPELAVFKQRTENTAITWDPVVSVEYTGRLETGYDLTVPGAETFMASNGIILSNTVNLHALVTPDARKEALNKMLPSKNLFSVAQFKAHQMPEKDLVTGLLAASTEDEQDKPEIVFATAADAIRAFKSDGNMGLGRRIKILDKSK